jgi:hypothetical protein
VSARAVGANLAKSESGLLQHSFAELLIDCEEDRTLRAVLVRMLREAERRREW